jgi:hypothetical protein
VGAIGVNELEEMVDQPLVVSVRENGHWPRLEGYSAIEYFDQPFTFPDAEIIMVLAPDGEEGVDIKANLTQLKKLPKELTKYLFKATKKEV